MRFLPSNRSQWVGFFSRPFQAYIVSAAFFYFHWLDQLHGTRDLVFRYMLHDGRVFFAGGYFFSFFALSIIAIIQEHYAERRSAFWNAAFAVSALITAYRLWY